MISISTKNGCFSEPDIVARLDKNRILTFDTFYMRNLLGLEGLQIFFILNINILHYAV